MTLHQHKKEILEKGFTIIENVFPDNVINSIIEAIQKVDCSKPAFRKTKGLFAIRGFLREVPEVLPFIFTQDLNLIINQVFGPGYFVVKSIYFDKPADSNWFVSYHQDLTISVDKKINADDFGPWTIKQSQFAVQPPVDILENIFTIRIHLDKTDVNNGALRVINGSHSKGVFRAEMIDWQSEVESLCEVPKGGIMIMKPLLFHASSRTTNDRKRRVIHIEFSNRSLPNLLKWSERLDIEKITQ